LTFSADEFAPARDADGNADLLPWSRFRYHVAAVELGVRLPWLAVAVRRMHAPSQQIYPGRRGAGLGLPGRAGKDYVLYAGDAAGAAGVLTGPVRQWLGASLALLIKHRPLVTIEASGGWAMCAIQAGGTRTPSPARQRPDRPATRKAPASPPADLLGRRRCGLRLMPRLPCWR
jgi:hypothetical protein